MGGCPLGTAAVDPSAVATGSRNLDRAGQAETRQRNTQTEADLTTAWRRRLRQQFGAAEDEGRACSPQLTPAPLEGWPRSHATGFERARQPRLKTTDNGSLTSDLACRAAGAAAVRSVPLARSGGGPTGLLGAAPALGGSRKGTGGRCKLGIMGGPSQFRHRRCQIRLLHPGQEASAPKSRANHPAARRSTSTVKSCGGPGRLPLPGASRPSRPRFGTEGASSSSREV